MNNIINGNTTTGSTISCFVVCCNEENHIGRCLASVAQWCDELIVIDSGSTDRTLEIAKSHNATIVNENWRGFVEQKRFGLSLCKGNWVLNIDADEEVSPELAAELTLAVAQADPTVSGFEINRIVFYLRRWWRVGGWYPEFRLRVLRRNAADWGGTNPHEHAIVKHGEIVRLVGELRHYTYDDIADQLRTLNAHSSTAAQSLIASGYQFMITDLLFRPIIRMFKFYVLKGGFKEGLAGLIVAVHEALYVFLKYGKVWEIQALKRDGSGK